MSSTVISKVDLTLFGEQHIQGLDTAPSLGHFPNQLLPFSFKFNSNWSMGLTCPGCGKNVSFSETLHTVPKHSPRLLPLTTAYYSKDQLAALVELVPGSELIWNADIEAFLVTEASFPDKNASILSIPIITLMYFQCPGCGGEYVCKYRFGAGFSAESAGEEGKLSEMQIDSLIYLGKNSSLLDGLKTA